MMPRTKSICILTSHALEACQISRSVSASLSNNINTTLSFQSNPSPLQIQTIRSKHSNRQVKRLFKQHPAFHRVSQRNEALPKKHVTPPPTVNFQPIFDPPVILKNGWSQPPDDEETIHKRDLLPFGVQRTGGKPNGAVGFLPVYSNFKHGGSRQTTIIKKISGDKDIFLQELRAVLSISADDNDSIRMKASGATIEVNGNRTKEVKTWLCQLGF